MHWAGTQLSAWQCSRSLPACLSHAPAMWSAIFPFFSRDYYFSMKGCICKAREALYPTVIMAWNSREASRRHWWEGRIQRQPICVNEPGSAWPNMASPAWLLLPQGQAIPYLHVLQQCLELALVVTIEADWRLEAEGLRRSPPLITQCHHRSDLAYNVNAIYSLPENRLY